MLENTEDGPTKDCDKAAENSWGRPECLPGNYLRCYDGCTMGRR